MAVEFTAIAIQTVEPGQNAVFTENPVSCNKGYVTHRSSSGIVTLNGITNNCRARYKVSFSGNIAVSEGEDTEEISLAVAIKGEAVASTIRRVTPGDINRYFSVAGSTFVDVFRCKDADISIRNTSGVAVDIQNLSLIIERVA